MHVALGDILGLDPRQWGLVGAGYKLALAGTAIALLLGTAVGLQIAYARRTWSRAAWLVLALWPMLVPPYVYVYLVGLLTTPDGVFGTALHRLGLEQAVDGFSRAALSLGAWASTLPAVIVGAGWNRWAGPAMRLASTECGAWRALWLVGLRAARVLWAAALIGCLALTSAETSIASLCSISTWQSELLLEASLAQPAWRLALQSWPLLVPALGAAGILLFFLRLPDRAGVAPGPDQVPPPTPRGLSLLAGAAVLVTTALPLLMVLVTPRRLGWAAAVAKWLADQGAGLGESTVTGLCGAALSILVVILVPARWRNRLAALWLVIGLLPAAVLGQTLLAHQQAWLQILPRGGFNELFGRLHLVLISMLRFGWVAPLVLIWSDRSLPEHLPDLVKLDGLTRGQRFWRVDWPLHWPAYLGTGLLIVFLNLSEAGAGGLVLPPGVAHLATSLLNQMHYGRRDDLLAACGVLSLGGVLGAAVMTGIGYRYRRGGA